MGVEATGIRQAWREEVSSESRQLLVMSGDGSKALDIGNAQVIGGPCGETTQDRYAGTETR